MSVLKMAHKSIVPKASDGQRYPLPLSQCILGYGIEGGSSPKQEPMTYALLGFERGDLECSIWAWIVVWILVLTMKFENKF